MLRGSKEKNLQKYEKKGGFFIPMGEIFILKNTGGITMQMYTKAMAFNHCLKKVIKLFPNKLIKTGRFLT
jgi:hypothetical protein